MPATTPATTLQDRAVLRLSGEEVRDFLQGLVTQDMLLVQPGAPQWAGLLSAQGKALFDFVLWAEGEDILIDHEATASDALIAKLKLYRLRRKIGIAPDDKLAVHWSPETEAYPADPRLAELGRRWLAAPGNGDASAAWRAHRLSLGVTEGIAELGSEKTLWLECNAEELGGVSFVKGCYVGQENTARMHYRNKVNRRLVVVPLAEADEKRLRIAYSELGLAVEHRRSEDIDAAQAPHWLAAAVQK